MKARNLTQAFLRHVDMPPTVAPMPPFRLLDQKSVLMGRDLECAIVVDPVAYRAVSRQHAEITPVMGRHAPDGSRLWQICDLNSSNGTYVNGKRIPGCRTLRAGDRIMLGVDGPEFLFEVSDQPAVVSPPAESSEAGLALPRMPAAPPGRTRVAARPSRVSRPPGNDVSMTQLFPILSTGRELTRKAFLIPGATTIVFVVLLFLAVGKPIEFNFLLAAYLALAAFYFIYQLCGKHKPWWLLVGCAGMTMALLFSPVLTAFLFVFREQLPGAIPADASLVSLPELFVRMFIGAGLMEELFKALPILLVWGLGRQLRKPWRDRWGVIEPLDGILLGAASAVGFTLVETLGQYLPEVYHATMPSGEDAAQLASLQLLIPRVLGLVSGHMAYSGYLGYFIGLSVLRRRQRWLVLGVGYLTASLLHALWNVAGVFSPALLAVVGLLSYACLAAAILKARELSPTRSQNFATRFYGNRHSG